MRAVDGRGCEISGSTPAALHAYEAALAAFQCWRNGVDALLAVALREAPGFVMAHAMQAWTLVVGRDPRRVHMADRILARAAGLPANERERGHLAAIAAVLADDYDAAKAILADVLGAAPLDILALQVAHSFDYVTGDIARMDARVVDVLPAWSPELPGYHAVLAMHAFGLEEIGDYERAGEVASAALALNPGDARAHHVMVHIFEMTDRPAAGKRWMNEHVAGWADGTTVATHCWWHLALFHLALGEIDDALAVYDAQVRAGRSHEVADLIDAVSLLWRIHLLGGKPGSRWRELAAAWSSHIDDRFCSFTDLHAMLAFVGARQWDRARRLERVLSASSTLSTRHGHTTRQLGLPACRALIAFGRRDDALAIALLANLPARMHGLGGSHAQRDVLHLTMLNAIERLRRPRGVARFASKVTRSYA